MKQRGINLQYPLRGWRLFWLVTLRVFIGWHFLYEGLTKVSNPNWSAASYLMDSGGFFAGFFHAVAADPLMLQIADYMNVYGLMAIGLGLMLGLFEKPALLAGILLLGLYYLSHPPFTGIRYASPMEGSYLIVNRNLIEMAAMAVLFFFPTGRQIGMDRWRVHQKRGQ